MTSPPLVETAVPSSFKIFSSVSWALRFAVLQALSACEVSSALSAT